MSLTGGNSLVLSRAQICVASASRVVLIAEPDLMASEQYGHFISLVLDLEMKRNRQRTGLGLHGSRNTCQRWPPSDDWCAWRECASFTPVQSEMRNPAQEQNDPFFLVTSNAFPKTVLLAVVFPDSLGLSKHNHIQMGIAAND